VHVARPFRIGGLAKRGRLRFNARKGCRRDAFAARFQRSLSPPQPHHRLPSTRVVRGAVSMLIFFLIPKGASLMSENVTSVSAESFDTEVLQSDKPVLVDFWAEWCGPCRMIAPVLEQIADEKQEQLKVVKLNVDDNQEIAQRFSVRGIPTLILFKNGEAAATQTGAVGKAQLAAFVEQHI
jgi:thioredoxin 1